jgi:type IV secretory pathway VirB3-like protein
MKAPVLKALANPARIFFVPYNLAVLNFIFLFLIYMIVFATGLIFSDGMIAVNPLYFLLTLIAVHSLFAFWSKKEPFLARIFIAKLSLWRKKIPRKLIA